MPLNPQQLKFKEAYLNPNSPTFGNAYQSALEAGFSDEYAKVIKSKKRGWWSEMVEDQEMEQLAVGVLRETMEYNPVGEDGKIDSKLANVRVTAAKTVLPVVNPKWNPKKEIDVTSGGEKLGLEVNFVAYENRPTAETTAPILTQEI